MSISLSNKFFEHWKDEKPVLQILQSRAAESSIACVRLRCYDGSYSYDLVGIQKKLADLVINQNLLKHEYHPVVKILKYKKIDCTMIITHYEIVSKDEPIHGTPQKIPCKCNLPHPKEILDDKGHDVIPRSLARKESMNISFVSSYLIHRFSLTGVVSHKSVKEIQSKFGPTQLLSFLLTSAESNIMIKCFGNLIKKFQPVAENGNTLLVTCDPKCVQKSFKETEEAPHPFEIILDKNAALQLIED